MATRWTRFRKDKTAMAGLAVIALVVAAAVLAPWVAPFDPAEPNEKKRVHRGGSFLCTSEYCTRYMLGTRGKGEISTGSNHLGVRFVKPATS